MKLQKHSIIGGREVEGPRSITSINPATEEEIGTVSAIVADGVGQAVATAGFLVLIDLFDTRLDWFVPLALPVVSALGGDLVWFGIVTVIGVEIGLLTPPLGLSVYVIKSSLDDQSISLGAIFAGAFPFVLITLAVTILLMIFPQLTSMSVALFTFG